MILASINDYIQNKLVHSLHTTQRRSFRGCRRRHNWIFIDGYYPTVTVKPLEFGVAFHKAMEKLYDPITWHDRALAYQLARAIFVQTCDEQFAAYKLAVREGRVNNFVDLVAAEADYSERKELGLGMLSHYVKHEMHHDNGLQPVKVETEFEVVIKSPEGQELWCKCDRCWKRFSSFLLAQGGGVVAFTREQWKGLPVTYGGRFDALMIDEIGRYWIVDWKHLSITEPVLTPTGWKAIGDIKSGELVIGLNGSPVQVIGASPITTQDVWEVVWADGTIVECSATHKWSVLDRDNKLRTLTTEELSNAPTYQNFGTPINNPVEFVQHDNVPMHPYVLGLLLGDGHFKQELQFASKTGETVDLLRKYADKSVQFEDCRRFGGSKWVIRGPWKGLLEGLGLWGKLSAEKFIPNTYMFASVEDRLELLRGLYDTDGLVSTLRICTTSHQLAQDVANLIRSLGGKASVSNSVERTHVNGETINHPEYFINFWLEGFTCNKRPEPPKPIKGSGRRGIVRVSKTSRQAEMRCIAVDAPNNLYITRDYVVTHNTAARLSTGEPGADDDYLWLDDQITSYCWAMWTIGFPIAGFIYAELKKVAPEEPEPLSRPYKGRLYSTNKQAVTATYEMYKTTVSENDAIAYNNGLYDEFLEGLKDSSRFHLRHEIHRSVEELTNAGYNIYLEACDIIDPNLRVYPSPGRFGCRTCAFWDPCVGMNRNEDYQYYLDTMFEKREKHYFERDPSTDKPGRD